MIRELEAVARGEVDRLMLFLPPGSAKTTYASVLFPPWFMAQSPTPVDVIGASHGAVFAEDLSGLVIKTVQQNADILGFGMESERKELWRTTKGDVYRAAGAGGSITGRRADLFLIDDPIRGREDADSQPIRDKTWSWFQAEVLTRLKPGARIILIQTRWHEDDLAGRLLEEMAAGADQWRIVSLPALAEADDPMGREIGAPLWPEWEGTAALERKRIAVGEREWAALYQQRPRPTEGALFKVSAIAIIDAEPAGCKWVRGWDLAATASVGTRSADYTAGVRLGRMPDGRFVIADVVRDRVDPAGVEQLVRATASRDGKGVRISIPQDPGGAGKAWSRGLTSGLAGFDVHVSRESGDKATRAAAVASQANVGNLLLVRGSWNRATLDELSGFPSASHDDVVDALSRAFNLLAAVPSRSSYPKPLVLSNGPRMFPGWAPTANPVLGNGGEYSGQGGKGAGWSSW
jgi:predicted phage terminase large subunit-like protein